jgi:hypothetical protein
MLTLHVNQSINQLINRPMYDSMDMIPAGESRTMRARLTTCASNSCWFELSKLAATTTTTPTRQRSDHKVSSHSVTAEQ